MRMIVDDASRYVRAADGVVHRCGGKHGAVVVWLTEDEVDGPGEGGDDDLLERVHESVGRHRRRDPHGSVEIPIDIHTSTTTTTSTTTVINISHSHCCCCCIDHHLLLLLLFMLDMFPQRRRDGRRREDMSRYHSPIATVMLQMQLLDPLGVH